MSSSNDVWNGLTLGLADIGKLFQPSQPKPAAQAPPPPPLFQDDAEDTKFGAAEGLLAKKKKQLQLGPQQLLEQYGAPPMVSTPQ